MGKKKDIAPIPIEDVTLPVTNCERCPILCKSRKRIVNGRGPEDAAIMVVGEGPGVDEDRTAMPFVGKSGDVLGYLMSEAGIDLTDVRLTNAVRCRPPGNRTPKPEEIAACNPYLVQEIKEVMPKVIITVGLPALKAVMDNRFKKLGDVVGQAFYEPHFGIPVVPTYHPSYLMRGRWGQIPQVVQHMEKANAISKGRNPVQDLEEARANTIFAKDLDTLTEMVDFLLSEDVSIITLDSESFGSTEEWSGLDWMGAELLCLSFSGLDENRQPLRAGWAVPLLQKDALDWWGDDADAAFDLIGRLLVSDKPKCIQNSLHDIRLMERAPADQESGAVDEHVRGLYGWRIENVAYDTMLIQRLLDENLPANENALMTAYTDMPYYEEDVLKQTKQKTHMELGENEAVWTYAALDSDALARILAAQLKKLQKKPNLQWILENITMPMVRASWNMTRRGVAMDIDFMMELCDRYLILLTEARQAVFDAYGHGTFNLNAPGQVQHALFSVLKLPKSGRKTKASRSCDDCSRARNDPRVTCEKHDATGKDALKDIQKLTDHPIIPAFLHWKEVSHQKKNYVDGIDGNGGVAAKIRPDLRLHPELKINVATSGRDSIVKPALQQMPKGVEDEVLGHNILRRPYVAGPGRKCGEVDWSQGEVWVLAYRTKDETLLGLLKGGRDVHTFVARSFCEQGVSDQFPKSSFMPGMSEQEWKEAFDMLRKHAKVFVFGIGYGMQEQGIAERLHCALEEAAVLRNIYVTRIFPGINDYFDEIGYEMEHHGVIYDEFGREGHFYDADFIKKHARNDWEEMFRTGTNMPIQGGLTDLQQYTHPRVEAAFNGRIWITLTVHDSIFFEYPEMLTPDEEVGLMWDLKKYHESTARQLVKWDGTPLDWEIPVEVAWGDSWGHLPNKISASGNLVGPQFEEGT